MKMHKLLPHITRMNLTNTMSNKQTKKKPDKTNIRYMLSFREVLICVVKVKTGAAALTEERGSDWKGHEGVLGALGTFYYLT